MNESTDHSGPVSRDISGIAYALFFSVLGGLALYHTKDMSKLGAVFPQTIASALIIFSLAYITQEFLAPGAARPQSSDGSWIRRGLLIGVMLVWVLSLNILGFVAAGVFGFVGMILVGNYDVWSIRRVLTYATVSVVVIGGFYTLFAIVLNVPLPPAPWLEGL